VNASPIGAPRYGKESGASPPAEARLDELDDTTRSWAEATAEEEMMSEEGDEWEDGGALTPESEEAAGVPWRPHIIPASHSTSGHAPTSEGGGEAEGPAQRSTNIEIQGVGGLAAGAPESDLAWISPEKLSAEFFSADRGIIELRPDTASSPGTPPRGFIRTSIHHEYDIPKEINAVPSEIRLTAPMPWGEIAFMMNPRRD
jgi:hypothetical protein